jgi:hypothetical protein
MEAIERAAKEHFQFPDPDIDNGPLPDPAYKGKGLQIELMVEDAGAFTMPWSATIISARPWTSGQNLSVPKTLNGTLERTPKFRLRRSRISEPTGIS